MQKPLRHASVAAAPSLAATSERSKGMSDSTRTVPYGGDVLVAVMDGDGGGRKGKGKGTTLVYYKRSDDASDAVRLACVLGDDEEKEGGDEDPWRDVAPLLDSGLHAFEARVEEGVGWKAQTQPSAPALERAIEKWVILPLFAASTATRVTGDVEIFTPHRGTNTRWHKDGYLPGCYIGHALVSTEGASEDGDEDADWFEQALVERGASEGDDEASFAVPDFGGQESMARGVSVGNFVPIKAMRRGGVLVVFEDATTLHRSPKFAAKSLEAMERVLLRFNFSATDCEGSEVTLFAPPSCVWASFDERGAVRALTQNVSSVALAEQYVRD